MRTALQVIARDPHSDAARLVAVDHLAEEDPELAAFVQLQLVEEPTEAQRRELQQLYRAHHRRWLGPLAEVLAPGHYRFSRGFLSVANVVLESRRQARSIARHPHWATVEQLAGGRHLPTLLRHASLPALHTLGTAFLPGPDDTRVCPDWGLALRSDRLAGIHPPRLRGLQLDLSSETLVQAFLNCFGRGSLAGLTELGIRCEAPVHKAVIEEFPDTLRRLSLDVPQREIETWLKLVLRLFPRLQTVDVVLDARVVSLRRDREWRGLEAFGSIPRTWP